MEHNRQALIEHILPLSQSQNFPAACKEWIFVTAHISEEVDNCPCGQAIKELCYIENRLTRHQTYVGNVCVNRFMGIDTGNLFDGLRRIARDINANANADVIAYAWERKFIRDPKEHGFLLGIRNKRKATAAQAAWRADINRRILQQVVSKKREQGRY